MATNIITPIDKAITLTEELKVYILALQRFISQKNQTALLEFQRKSSANSYAKELTKETSEKLISSLRVYLIEKKAHREMKTIYSGPLTSNPNLNDWEKLIQNLHLSAFNLRGKIISLNWFFEQAKDKKSLNPANHPFIVYGNITPVGWAWLSKAVREALEDNTTTNNLLKQVKRDILNF